MCGVGGGHGDNDGGRKREMKEEAEAMVARDFE